MAFRKHWNRLKRSLGRRWREWRLPRGFRRLGTRYGGWWIDVTAIGDSPLLIDCGLGADISFPVAFLEHFGGRVIGVDPNPKSLAYCRQRCPPGMEIRANAFWKVAGESLTFHLPRPKEQLPKGADGVSGSLLDSHEYVAGGDAITVTTTSLAELLADAGRHECDVLKLDIEGAEYEVFAALCRTGEILRARQILVEFHHRVTDHSIEQTLATAKSIEHAGFRLIHVEGRNYIFRRHDHSKSRS